jgi:hypothetical protein
MRNYQKIFEGSLAFLYKYCSTQNQNVTYITSQTIQIPRPFRLYENLIPNRNKIHRKISPS